MQTPNKYSHNAYWNKNPVGDTIYAGLDAIEFDIVYSLLRKTIYCSHSWKPLDCMYYGSLNKNLFFIKLNNEQKSKKIKYVIIESKSFWINQKKLHSIMKRYFPLDIVYVMSVQNKYFWQKPRQLWLNSFYKKYKKELAILDKRTQTNLNEQINLYNRKWYMF